MDNAAELLSLKKERARLVKARTNLDVAQAQLKKLNAAKAHVAVCLAKWKTLQKTKA